MEGCVKIYVWATRWYLNGKRHRTDGPAFVATSGARWWYLDGQEVTEKEFNERSKAWKDM